MRHSLVAALALLACVGPGHASGYDEFTAGLNANIRGDSEKAITSFTAALTAGDLAPGYVPVAHRGRALAYLELKRCAEANAELDASAAVRPLDRSGHLIRAMIMLCLKDTVAAQQEFDTAMAVYPDAHTYSSFGRALWEKGYFAEAHPNLLRAAELVKRKENRSASYVVIWYAINADRIGKLDQKKLGDFAEDIGGREWPMAVLRLYLGKLKPEELAAKAEHGNDDVLPGQRCEADFYAAEWYISHRDSEKAKPLIQSAVGRCPKNFVEYYAAVTEADRLGVAISKEAAQ